MSEQTARYKDFDAAFAEQQEEGVTFTLFGETETLPAFLPAGVVLEIMRLQAARGTDFREEDVLQISIKLFGSERLNRWVDKGLDIRQLADLTGWSLQQYGLSMQEEQQATKGKSRKKLTS